MPYGENSFPEPGNSSRLINAGLLLQIRNILISWIQIQVMDEPEDSLNSLLAKVWTDTILSYRSFGRGCDNSSPYRRFGGGCDTTLLLQVWIELWYYSLMLLVWLYCIYSFHLLRYKFYSNPYSFLIPLKLIIVTAENQKYHTYILFPFSSLI